MALAEGMHVGSYELLSPLGADGGDEAWLASDTSSEAAPLRLLRRVPAGCANNPGLMRAVEAELPVASRIEHPHLVRVFEIAGDGREQFIVSEFVAGRSLRQIQHRARTLAQAPPMWFTLHVAVVVCEALAYVHARCGELGDPLASVRQELSLESVVISFAGDPRWMSFGLTRTPAYAAPELRGKLAHTPLDHARADVYSAGLLLYEMLTSRSPFDPGDHLSDWCDPELAPIPPSQIAPWVPEPLEHIVMTAMARDVSDRYRNAGELRQALLEYMERAGVRPARKHLAQQVCGMLAPADSDPPSSARAGPTAYRRLPSDGPPLGPISVLGMPSALGTLQQPARESARDRAAAVWERLTGLARIRKAKSVEGAAAAAGSGGQTPGPMPLEPSSPAAKEAAVKHFEQALELVRRKDFEGAIAELEGAVRFDPENRVYLTNLKKLKKSLDGGDA